MENNETMRAQVGPNTTLYVLANVPLDNTYQNTMYFGSLSDQVSTFMGKRKYTFNAMSYQRHNANRIRVERSSDTMIDCNYLMFQNTDYGNKWFYAFINEVNYVNEVTTELVYEIDVMQTWFFDFRLGHSFVEREHVANDDWFEYIADEGLETGDYIWGSSKKSTVFNTMSGCVMAVTKSDGSALEDGDDATGVYNGVWCGAKIYPKTSITAYRNYMKKAQEEGQMDAVIAAYMAPSTLVSYLSSGGGTKDSSYLMQVPVYTGTFGGYQPKNKKLYCYPFNFLVVDAVENQQIYKYELFNINGNQLSALEFDEYGTILPNPVGVTMPRNYAGSQSAGIDMDTSYALTIGNFPINGMNSDTYKAWVAQNSNTTNNSTLWQWVGGALSALGGAALMGIGIAGMPASGGLTAPVVAGGMTMLGGATTMVSSVASNMAKKSDVAALPDKHIGSEAADVFSMNGSRTFTYRNRHITREYAERIDKYFSMFGYKVNTVKVPNINVRPHFTFCKTCGCNIIGSVPAQDAKKICSIFDQGITHWKNMANIGNYNLDNRAVSRETAEVMSLDMEESYASSNDIQEWNTMMKRNVEEYEQETTSEQPK